jgi:hypothetical protein
MIHHPFDTEILAGVRDRPTARISPFIKRGEAGRCASPS